MSNSLWKKLLSEKLKNLARRNNPRLAIIGIGAELNGDDALGICAARKLETVFSAAKDVLVLEGGTLPESITGPLRRFLPELVIFVDAADLGGSPGEIQWIDPRQIGGASFSTHSIPLSILIDYLSNEIECEVLLLGVQPKALDFGVPLSEECITAINEITDQFTRIINF